MHVLQLLIWLYLAMPSALLQIKGYIYCWNTFTYSSLKNVHSVATIHRGQTEFSHITVAKDLVGAEGHFSSLLEVLWRNKAYSSNYRDREVNKKRFEVSRMLSHSLCLDTRKGF